jgi:hypothetical protein
MLVSLQLRGRGPVGAPQLIAPIAIPSILHSILQFISFLGNPGSSCCIVACLLACNASNDRKALCT